MYYSPILSFLRIIFFLLWTLICAPVQFFFLFSSNYLFLITRIYFKGLTIICGLKIQSSGTPRKNKTVFISNHTSYLDILILGSKLNGLFVAKSEIAKWPFINKLSQLAKTIFIDRNKIFSTKKQVEVLDYNLNKGFNIILFPEGTSNDGNKVLPFKSSLFSIAELKKNKSFYFQPISITYTHLDGMPISRIFRPFFAWYGDMDLISHAWRFLGMGNCEININYHKPIQFDHFLSRKELSNYCYKIISNQVSIDLGVLKNKDRLNLYNYKYL